MRKKAGRKESFWSEGARIYETPSWVLMQELAPLANEDEADEDYLYDDLVEDDEEGLSNEDLGFCPHGCTDDEGCEEPGCPGGPAGWQEDDDGAEYFDRSRLP